jgi:adenine specific DNA methylase Mod
MKDLIPNYYKKIDLIYIDPPFATGGSFNFRLHIGNEKASEVVKSYSDSWKGGIDAYLSFLYERILLMKELLADTGSIYIHLDWHISHYLKILLDEIFGLDNFRNEIIWMYPAASAQTRRFFIRSYDVLLFYTKSDNYIFNDDPEIYMEYSDRVKNALKEDERGRFYYRGGSHNGKKLSQKVYLKQDGIFPRDIWNDIPYVRANTAEYQGFSTQKPERLLKRIILASTRENDVVADFFCGSGTTLAAAEKLGRKWIGCDLTEHAINICRKRILDIEHSNDLLAWKDKYNLSPKYFKILAVPVGNKDSYIRDQVIKGFQKFIPINNPNFSVKIIKQDNNISINLIDYTVPYDDLVSENIMKNIKSYSDWIDYWAIDFDHTNNNFKAKWFSYRTPKNRSIRLTSDSFYFEGERSFNIAVIVTDILGITTTQTYIVNNK